MSQKSKKVFVAISGGVDSSVAAAILLREGHDCAGLFMITHDDSQQAQASAEQAAKQLGMEFYVLDVRSDFVRIIDYFCGEYKSGRTPNPCVVCNRTIKFGKLWDFARDNGAEFLATGHYARILPTENGPGLFRAVDEAKDQSYALAMMDKKMLDRVILPVGQFTKTQTRQMAKKLGLVAADRKESQEICFVPDNDHIGFLESRRPGLVRKGKVIDGAGRILGEHNGIHRFTIGQRRGIRIAMGNPHYVVKLDAATNTVTLGPKSDCLHTKLLAGNINWLIREPTSPFRAMVKIRYNARPVSATVTPRGNSVSVEFDEPVSAITPGQLAVFYIRQNGNMPALRSPDSVGTKDEQVAGAGWIEKSLD